MKREKVIALLAAAALVSLAGGYRRGAMACELAVLILIILGAR